MTPRTQTEVFIQTLKEMRDQEPRRDDESDGEKAQLRLKVKARVKRFVKEFRSDFDGRRHALEMTPRARRPAHQAGERARDD